MEQIFDLQRFADGEGSDGAGGNTTSPVAGENEDGPAVVYGKPPAAGEASEQPDETAAEQAAEEKNDQPPEAKPSFDELIRGEYKQEFDKRVQKIINERFKRTKSSEERLTAIEPMVQLLAQRYGVDPEHPDKLLAAVEEDDAYYQDEAVERGITVQELKRIKRVERENAALRRSLEEQNARKQRDEAIGRLIQQAEQARELYPSLDLNQEMQNDGFARLVANGIDVKTAYEVVHRQELTQDAMRYSAQKAQQAVANAVKAGAARPDENGMGNAPGVVVKSDPSKLTQRDFEDIKNRVRRGEKIVF